MLIWLVQNGMQSVSDKNINETQSLALKDHKINYLQSFLISVCLRHLSPSLKLSPIHRLGPYEQILYDSIPQTG